MMSYPGHRLHADSALPETKNGGGHDEFPGQGSADLITRKEFHSLWALYEVWKKKKRQEVPVTPFWLPTEGGTRLC